MSTVADILTALVRDAVVAAGHGDVPLADEPAVPTSDAKHGDYQSNHAFRLAKVLKQNPRQVAEAVKALVPAHPAVASVEVAGPGFLNFRLSDAWLGGRATAAAADPRLALPSPGTGRTMVIDYSSPNIAKRMHVGHLRSTILGNALHRMHLFLGWTVIADNHIGDWGTQFGRLIVAWDRVRDDAAYAADPIAELQRLYQWFGAEAKEDAGLVDLARAETAKLQAGDARNRGLWEEFCAASMREFDAMYARLGVKFDVTLGESAYRDGLDALVEDMLARGIAVHDQGAVIVPFTAEDDASLAESPLLVRKSDGAALYGTTDLATVKHRVETWNPERIVYVTDVRQRQHFQQFFAASRKLGFTVQLEHVWFGMLKLPGGVIAASRTGDTLNLVDVLDEAARRAREVVDQRSDEIPEAERAAIAAAVGTGALKYADLSQNPQTDIQFEWDKMLALQGNTAPYMMYAHARCRSILRKAGDKAPGPVAVGHPLERELVLSLLQLGETLLVAAHTARPNLLADHLFRLGQTFARFYLDCPVLRDDVPADVAASRLTLVAATADALKLGLGLLGIDAPDRM